MMCKVLRLSFSKFRCHTKSRAMTYFHVGITSDTLVLLALHHHISSHVSDIASKPLLSFQQQRNLVVPSTTSDHNLVALQKIWASRMMYCIVQFGKTMLCAHTVSITPKKVLCYMHNGFPGISFNVCLSSLILTLPA